MDFVGPLYLRGGLRFYALNSAAVATGRGESFPAPPEAIYEYVRLTIDVER